MKTEKEKMLAGELYYAGDPILTRERWEARKLLRNYNQLPEEDTTARAHIIKELIPDAGEGLEIQPPFYCDYGKNIKLGTNVYFNFNCVILDVAPVIIGNNCLFGPAVQIYTPTHPLDHAQRASGMESGKHIEIGNHVWVGGNVTICPGVSIGDRSVIGAGSVVTKNIPAGVFAAGNPCKIIRELE
ncbi:sugar O-acetyltransferase [Antarcticibacterium arcticum]|uniref:Acetyltransferase n=1 Tax=Antarcticibacterium arcticum TaxID=2585771 RepID=A0A5B8YI39_9FLAO|nr:sugar O-acetyltransferase [Antarcticibacterium arcticum]QED37602.1 sugar O-acetyltransferase [Antarcticibacterium arcticum]